MRLEKGDFNLLLRNSIETIQSSLLSPSNLYDSWGNYFEDKPEFTSWHQQIDFQNEPTFNYIRQEFLNDEARIFRDSNLNQVLFSAIKNGTPLINWVDGCKELIKSYSDTDTGLYSPIQILSEQYIESLISLIFRHRSRLSKLIRTIENDGKTEYSSPEILKIIFPIKPTPQSPKVL